MSLSYPPGESTVAWQELDSWSATKSQQDKQEKEKALRASGIKYEYKSDGEEDREAGVNEHGSLKP